MSELWDLVEKLQPWPPLQYALVIAIVLFSAITYWHVLRSKMEQSPASSKPEVEALLLFSGPFGKLEAKLDTVLANQRLNKAEMREAFAEALRETRHSMVNKLAEAQAEIKEDIANSEANVRADIGGTRREMREMRDVVNRTSDLVIRIEARRGRA